jgi:hypothetical protein
VEIGKRREVRQEGEVEQVRKEERVELKVATPV